MIKYTKQWYCDGCGKELTSAEDLVYNMHVEVDACGQTFTYTKDFCKRCKYDGMRELRDKLESIGFEPPYKVDPNNPNEVRIKNADLPPKGFEFFP